MHPEIRQPAPGNCPKCGMALEPLIPEAGEADGNPELEDFRRRFWWSLPLTVAVAVLAMAGYRLGWMAPATQSWVELVLTLPIVLWAAAPFFQRGVQSLVHRSPNMWSLISLGTGAAFVYSVVATVELAFAICDQSALLGPAFKNSRTSLARSPAGVSASAYLLATRNGLCEI